MTDSGLTRPAAALSTPAVHVCARGQMFSDIHTPAWPTFPFPSPPQKIPLLPAEGRPPRGSPSLFIVIPR